MASRIENAFKTIFRVPQGQNIRHVSTEIYVCHANVIRFFALRALQLPPEGWLRLCTMNCSVTHVTISPDGKVSLRSLGDTGHLSVDEVTFGTYTGTNW